MDESTTEESPAHESAENEMRLKVESILSQVDEWRQLSYHADRRYAELLRHFNGGDLEVMTDSTGKEVAYYANFNVARSRLLKISRERMQGYYSKLGIFDVKLTGEMSGIPGLELAANEALSKIFRSDMRMTPHYKATVEDGILVGRGVLWRRDSTQIIPERGRLLAHPDCIAAQRDDSLGEWAFASTVKAADLFRIAQKSKDEDVKAQAKRLLQAIVKRHCPEATPFNWPTDDQPWEFLDTSLRATGYGRKALATVIPCYWYFEKDLSGNPSERPVSVYCVARHGVDLSMVADDKGKVSAKENRGKDCAEGLIYKKDNAFKDSAECLWLFTIGEQFGGEPTLGRIKGEGEIQYSADIRIQKMLNSMLRRIEVENLTLFKNSGNASKKELDDLAANPLRDHDVLPEAIEFVERRFGDKPLNGMMQFVGLLSGYAADHAAVDTGHTDAPREENFKDQVLERLNDRVAAKTISESAWSDSLDLLAQMVGKLIFDATLVKSDEAWQFREAFFTELKDAGYDIDQSKMKGKAKVQARRNPGHGDMGVAMARADANIVLAQMTGPEAVERAVFEKAVLVAGGDVQKAIALIGKQPGGQAEQGEDAENAQNQMAAILAAGVMLTPQANDNPYIHTAVQMTLLEGALAGYQQDGGWTKNDMRCWDAAFAHAIQDIARIPMEDMKKESMKRVKALQTTAAALPIFEQGQPAVDPVDQAKLQLAAAEAERKRQKDATADEHWQRTQTHREQVAADTLALQQHQAISSGVRLDREAAGKQASRQLSDAIAINEATTPEPQPEPVAA